MGYLRLGIALAFFQVVVIADEQPVEQAIAQSQFFHQDQATLFVKSLVNITDDPLAVEWADELQSQVHDHHRGIVHHLGVMQVGKHEIELPSRRAKF